MTQYWRGKVCFVDALYQSGTGAIVFERLRQEIMALDWLEIAEGVSIIVSIAISNDLNDAKHLLFLADQAKQQGRNRVCAASKERCLCCFGFNNGISMLKFSDQLPSVAKYFSNLLLPVANALLCCLNRHKPVLPLRALCRQDG